MKSGTPICHSHELDITRKVTYLDVNESNNDPTLVPLESLLQLVQIDIGHSSDTEASLAMEKQLLDEVGSASGPVAEEGLMVATKEGLRPSSSLSTELHQPESPSIPLSTVENAELPPGDTPPTALESVKTESESESGTETETGAHGAEEPTTIPVSLPPSTVGPHADCKVDETETGASGTGAETGAGTGAEIGAETGSETGAVSLRCISPEASVEERVVHGGRSLASLEKAASADPAPASAVDKAGGSDEVAEGRVAMGGGDPPRLEPAAEPNCDGPAMELWSLDEGPDVSGCASWREDVAREGTGRDGNPAQEEADAAALAEAPCSPPNRVPESTNWGEDDSSAKPQQPSVTGVVERFFDAPDTPSWVTPTEEESFCKTEPDRAALLADSKDERTAHGANLASVAASKPPSCFGEGLDEAMVDVCLREIEVCRLAGEGSPELTEELRTVAAVLMQEVSDAPRRKLQKTVDMNDLPLVLGLVVRHLEAFASVLEMEAVPIPASPDRPQPPRGCGRHRVACVDLLTRLALAFSPAVDNELVAVDIPRAVGMMLFDYPLCSAMHAAISRFLEALLSQPDSGLLLAFVDSPVPRLLAKLGKESLPLKPSRRPGNCGHAVSIARRLRDVVGNRAAAKKVRDILEESEEWVDFVSRGGSGTLAALLREQNGHLGGPTPSFKGYRSLLARHEHGPSSEKLLFLSFPRSALSIAGTSFKAAFGLNQQSSVDDLEGWGS